MTVKTSCRVAAFAAAAVGVFVLAAPAFADFVPTSPEVLGQTCTAAGKCGDLFPIDGIQDGTGKPILLKSFKTVSNFDAAKGECRIDVKPATPADADMLPFTKATYLQDQHGSMGKITVDHVFFHCKQR